MSADPHQPIPAAILDDAASWLARRDRGLTAAEQDDYMQWLQVDPRHAEALAQHAAALERMMQLYEWTPAHDTEPNPDLFAPVPARRSVWWRWAGISVGVAAGLTLLFIIGSSSDGPESVASAPKSYLRVNERMALPDGSRVELKDGTNLVVEYSDQERRVRLTGGEAHFSVWKDAQRPFIVDAAGVEVRAVGTAFNVRLEESNVQVLVTEGKVSVAALESRGDGQPNFGTGSFSRSPSSPHPPPSELFVTVGQRAVVPILAPVAETSAPRIEPVTTDDIARELAWQAPRLQFAETRLAEAIAEFNRLNRHQIEIGDAALSEMRIGGTFRPDNVEGFVRLLGTTLGVQAERIGPNRTVLRLPR